MRRIALIALIVVLLAGALFWSTRPKPIPVALKESPPARSRRPWPTPAPARSKPASAPSCPPSSAAASNIWRQGRRQGQEGPVAVEAVERRPAGQRRAGPGAGDGRRQARRGGLHRRRQCREGSRTPGRTARPRLRFEQPRGSGAHRGRSPPAPAATPPRPMSPRPKRASGRRAPSRAASRCMRRSTAPSPRSSANSASTRRRRRRACMTPPAIDLIDDSCLYVKAPMDEVDAPKIQPGQPVRISLDALPGQSMAGKVSASRRTSRRSKSRRARSTSRSISTIRRRAASCSSATAPTSRSSSTPATTCCAFPPPRSEGGRVLLFDAEWPSWSSGRSRPGLSQLGIHRSAGRPGRRRPHRHLAGEGRRQGGRQGHRKKSEMMRRPNWPRQWRNDR
jgi:hypothetical protein